MNAGEYFKKSRPAWEAHPLVRHWRRLKEEVEGRKLEVELYRPKEGLVFRPPDLYVSTLDPNGTKGAPVKADWEDVLNEGLLHLQARAVSVENEAQRFGLWLQSTFAPVEAHFGETFFSPVLREVIAEGPFAKGLHVAKMLARIPPSRTTREQAWSDCREMIDNVIAGRWDELTDATFLGYSEAKATEILESALAEYLDERFNISNREALGWT